MATPMQKQYNKLKKKYKDCILLFRLGDFYEGFDNDAKIMSKVLGIVLTSRGKGKKKRPMAGIPHHSLENYLHKLVEAGYKVAIAEQMEEPQKGKKVVDRDVVRVVTAGTITSEKSLEDGKNNFLSSIFAQKSSDYIKWGISTCDLTTGEFFISEFYTKSFDDISKLADNLRRISPAEVLISKKHKIDVKSILPNSSVQKVDDYEYNLKESKEALKKHFSVKTLKGFGVDKYEAALVAAGVLINYLKDTQKTSLAHIKTIKYISSSDFMILDESTIRNLELVEPIRSDSSATLLKVVDKCLTSMGKRKIYQWILQPLKKHDQINKRQNSVEEFLDKPILLKTIRKKLDEVYDVERILGKIGNETVNAKDLLALKKSLKQIVNTSKKMKDLQEKLNKTIMKSIKESKEIEKVIELIEESIVNDPPDTITEGKIIKEGYSGKLDKVKSVYKSGKDWLKDLEKQEKQRTGIQSLKVKYNKVFGYYIEVSKANLDKVPDNYIRKQTLTNSERYFTKELKAKEDEILHAEEKTFDLEYEIFIEIREKLTKFIKQIQNIADKVAVLDCIANFAYIAREKDYSKPEILNSENGELKIIDGRHPTVEEISDEEFIPNSTELDTHKQQLAIITGPNMSGKSTYIRQVALITLLAQIGCFVPAREMSFTPVDRIFTRVGANDNLAGGESTFLVEMNETANILNNATKDSLIILDEVGRGTSTYDGVAIAWAVSEYIHDKIGAKTLFATHYHELVDLKKYLPRIGNYNVTVKESEDNVIFLRKIEKGSTDKSYGIHVAELAGVPDDVIQKAKEILQSLEQEGMFEVKRVESEIVQKKQTSKPRQIQLIDKLPENPVIKELKKVNINKMTPLEALDKLNEIIKKLK